MRRFAVASIATLCGCATFASAARVDLFIFENADGVSSAIVDLWVDVVDQGTHVDFTFHNDSTDGVVTAVYFESTNLLTNGSIFGSTGTVNFASPATPPNPPGSIGAFGGSWAGNLYSVDADPPPATHGIDVGETLTLRFELVGTYAQVLAALAPDAVDGFRIAEHAQSFGEASLWVTNTAPTPGTFALLTLGGFAAARRRR